MAYPSDTILRKLAGTAAFERGAAYLREGRVRLLRADESGFEAQVSGSQTYQLRLQWDGEGLTAHCDCPVDAFCKHLVAGADLARRRICTHGLPG